MKYFPAVLCIDMAAALERQSCCALVYFTQEVRCLPVIACELGFSPFSRCTALLSTVLKCNTHEQTFVKLQKTLSLQLSWPKNRWGKAIQPPPPGNFKLACN